MNGYINPTIFVPPVIAGIDSEILNIQEALGSILIIEKIFGQAFLQIERRLDYDVRAPYCYLKNHEPINLMPNDNVVCQSFFYVSDPEEIKDEGAFIQSFVSIANVSLIVWGNIDKIPGNSVETIKIKILEVLKKNPNIVLRNVYKSFEEVFSRFTITEATNNYNKLPFFGIRIDFTLNFVLNPENC